MLETFDVERTPEEVLAGRLEPRQGGLDPGRDGYVLSGDANVLHLALVSRVGVSEPLSWLISVRDTEELTQVLLERAVVQAAAHRTVEELLGMSKAEFTAEARRTLQGSFDTLEVGLEVTGLDLEQDLVPPGQARLAFEQVVQATQKSDQLRAKAEREAANAEGRAHTESARVAGEAAARAARLASEAEATARVVESLREQWERAPRELEQRLLVRALGEALPKVEEVFLLPEGELRVRLKRDTRARAREQERKAEEFTRRGY